MNNTLSKRLKIDLVATTFAIVGIFTIFHFLDAFEAMYTLTREHEEWEADEIFMLFLAFPIPLVWFSYRRIKDLKNSYDKQIIIENAIAHSQKLESLGTLAGGVAHEINNQLTPILSMSELLLEKLDKTDPNRRKVELIHTGAKNAKQTVLSIKEFSRLGSDEEQECDVFECLQYIINISSHLIPKNVKVKFGIEGASGNVPISMVDLESIIINILNNAVDALQEKKGEICLTAQTIDMSSPPTPTISSGKYVVINIIDTGVGMSKEQKKRIFDPLYTTKDVGEGMGIGLSQVHSIVSQSGGHISVDSKENDGSSFSIYLPVLG